MKKIVIELPDEYDYACEMVGFDKEFNSLIETMEECKIYHSVDVSEGAIDFLRMLKYAMRKRKMLRVVENEEV